MPRPDVAALFATNLAELPGPDGTTLRLFEYSQFGHAEDVKRRIELKAQNVGERLVHVAETHGYTFHHPTDPEPVKPTGSRTAALICPTCGDTIADLPLDDDDRLTPNALVLPTFLSQIGTHPCLSNPH